MFQVGEKVKIHGKGDQVFTVTRIAISDGAPVFAASSGTPGEPGNVTHGGLAEKDLATAGSGKPSVTE